MPTKYIKRFPYGYKHNKITRHKMSLIKLNWYKTHPNPMLNKIVSNETKLKLSRAGKRYYKTHTNPMLGRIASKSTKMKMRIARLKWLQINKNPMSGKTTSKKTKRKIRLATLGKKNHMFGKKHCTKIREKISKNEREYYKTHPSPMLGRKHNKESRRKMRLSSLKYISLYKNNGNSITPRTGKNERQILNFIQTQNNIKLKRQYLIDGYFIDGYDKENNVVYEVDEKHHHTLKQKKKDKEREKYIKNKLKCKFIRLDEKEYLDKLYR